MCGDEAAEARSMLQITYPVCSDIRMAKNCKFITDRSLLDGEWYCEKMG